MTALDTETPHSPSASPQGPPSHSAVLATTPAQTAEKQRSAPFSRARLYGLLSEAREITTRPRQRHCRYTPTGGTLDFRASTDSGQTRAYVTGLQTCGYSTCPHCGWRIRQKERFRLETLNRAHLESGGGLLHGVFTVSHGPLDPLSDLLDGLETGRRRVMGKEAGGSWKRTRDAFGVVGTTTHLEVVHGRNGWHPHYHVQILTRKPLTDDEAKDLSARMFGRYEAGLADAGCRALPDFNMFEPVRSAEAAARYLTKEAMAGQMAREATTPEGKISKGSTPTQILDRYESGRDGRDAALFREYERAMDGRRWRQWSRGLAPLYNVDEPDLEDGDTADAADSKEEMGGDIVFSIEDDRVRELARDSYLLAFVLDMIEAGNVDLAHRCALWGWSGSPPRPPSDPSAQQVPPGG